MTVLFFQGKVPDRCLYAYKTFNLAIIKTIVGLNRLSNITTTNENRHYIITHCPISCDVVKLSPMSVLIFIIWDQRRISVSNITTQRKTDERSG